MKPPRICYVSLKVGTREFIGEGNTRQAARHCAASKALEILRDLPMPDTEKLKAEAAEKSAEKEGAEKDGKKIFLPCELSLPHESPYHMKILCPVKVAYPVTIPYPVKVPYPMKSPDPVINTVKLQ